MLRCRRSLGAVVAAFVPLSADSAGSVTGLAEAMAALATGVTALASALARGSQRFCGGSRSRVAIGNNRLVTLCRRCHSANPRRFRRRTVRLRAIVNLGGTLNGRLPNDLLRFPENGAERATGSISARSGAD